MVNEMRESAFRPRAKLINILGRDLISDQVTGLIELVKNAYDADASYVRVTLHSLRDTPNTWIQIQDDGVGMSMDDVETKWLSPAVDHKDRAKRAHARSQRGRLPIGEKGVGRFAVQQLGRQLRMITRISNGPELVLNIDWDAFDNSAAFLNDVQVRIQERAPALFKDGGHGTALIITRLRDVWKESDVAKLSRALRRLQSPFKEWHDFHVSLVCSEFQRYENLDTSDILGHAHYEFRGYIDDDGNLDYQYDCRLPGLPPRTRANPHCELLPMARAESSGSMPNCGPFHLNLYVWDRTRDLLAASGVSRDDLDAHAGISLFRDGLRVLPYGEPGDDWLMLDRERINDPSHRIGNNQIIGYIELNQDENPDLRDKTNREGLIDNGAFRDLRALVRSAITAFTNEWLNDRPKAVAENDDLQYATQRRVPNAPTASLGKARTIAQAIEESASEEVHVQLSDEMMEREDGGFPDRDGDDGSEVEATPTVSQRAAATILVKELDKATDAVKERVTEDDEQRAILLHLAATGMAAERVVHEFGRQVSSAQDAAAMLRRARLNSALAAAVKTLDACLGALKNEFRVLAPYDAPMRTQSAVQVSVMDAVRLASELNGQMINAHAINLDVTGEDFQVKARPASVVQVLDNLLNNACYWLAQTAPGSSRTVQVVLDPAARIVTVADNGPGIPPEAEQHLFKPFFSQRSGGRGLGLYITRELVKQMGGSVHFCRPDSTPRVPVIGRYGAVFEIHFPDLADMTGSR